MSESLVRDYFPDAPEKCAACPALTAAAQRLSAYYNLSITASEAEILGGADTPSTVGDALADESARLERDLSTPCLLYTSPSPRDS